MRKKRTAHHQHTNCNSQRGDELLAEITRFREELRREDREIRDGVEYIKKHVDKLWEHATQANDRLQDLEVQVNLLTRLLTTVCMEKLKMRLSVLKRLIRRIEHEEIEDSQIMHLERLFSLEPRNEKPGNIEKKDDRSP